MEKDEKETNSGVEFWEETEAKEAEETQKGFNEEGNYVAESEEDEDDGLDEKLGLNRHPHVAEEDDEEVTKQLEYQNQLIEDEKNLREELKQDAPDDESEAEENEEPETEDDEENQEEEEQPEEKAKEVKCPNVNCTFHLPFEEGAKCVNCGFTFTKARMAEFEEKDLHEEANEEFMEEINEVPKKLTPAQRSKKILEKRETIESFNQRLKVLKPIVVELGESRGFELLEKEITDAVHFKLDKKEYKDSKDGIKVLESIDVIVAKVKAFNAEYYGKKSDIKTLEEEIIKLKGEQLTLEDEEKRVIEENQKAAESSTELTEEQKIELAETAVPCEEDCTQCDETECVENPVNEADEDSDGSQELDSAIEETIKTFDKEEEIA